VKTLLVIDVQNDFCPGGSLAVKDGDKVVPVINRARERFDQVIFTQDWHPKTHKSFAVNHPGKKPYDQITLGGMPQTLWPVHCVQGTRGAELRADLLVRPGERIFQKGTDPEIDSYSAFYDNAHRKSTGLSQYLRAQRVTELTLCGLATDYCVNFSALDALGEGFRVAVLAPACRGVNLQPDDSEKALEALRAKGATIAVALDPG
jgi:nicotinamidase/pyrazinamidase